VEGGEVPAAGGRGEGNRTGERGEEVVLMARHRGEGGDRGHSLRGSTRSEQCTFITQYSFTKIKSVSKSVDIGFFETVFMEELHLS
jgi:hypothetical protein